MPESIFTVRNSFNSGEISDLVSFRDDISKYNSSCLTLENAVPLVEGGAKKMPGTYFAGTTEGNQKARLVPFQFSTAQGAVLEFTTGMIRVWEGATEGDWSLGLATQIPENNYDPSILYAINSQVLIGPWTQITFFHPAHVGSPIFVPDFSRGALYVTAPWGTSNAYTVPVSVSLHSSDTLLVTKTGAFPNQGINIALANSTPSHNAATLIQAAIRSLVSLNSRSTNFVDLSKWTVTPSTIYFTSPWITAPAPPYSATSFSWDNSNWIGVCGAPNQNDQFPLSDDPTRFPEIAFNGPYWADGSSIVQPPLQLLTPYAQADLFDLDCSTQSADVLWIFHPNYPPAVVERFGGNSWKYSLSLPGQSPGEPPYRGTLDVVKTGYSALGQSISLISQSNPCIVVLAASSANQPFSSMDRIYINLCSGMAELNQGEFLVSGISYGSVTVTVIDSMGVSSTITTTGWHMSLFDPDTLTLIDSSSFLQYTGGGFAVEVVAMFAAPGDYPACGTLYQERLCVGGSNNNPTRMNGSVQDDYPDFICDPNAEDFAIQFTLVSNKLDQIVNMLGTPNALVLGTAGGVWVMAGGTGSSLSQTNVVAAKQSNMGVSRIQPQLMNDSAIFVSRSNRIVMFMVYNFVSNQWDNYDLTRLNRTITIGPTESQSGIIQTAFQAEPYPIFWAVRNDGQLLGLVFNKQDQVFAWFRIAMPTGTIESVAVISGQNQEDQVVVVVNRLVNGATARYVEYFMPQELFGQISNSFFVHSGQTLQLSGPFAITGINQGSPCIVDAPGHTFVNDQFVQITGVLGMTEINQDQTQAYQITGVATNSFELVGMDTTSFGAYIAGGSVSQVTNQVTGMSYLIGQTVTAIGDGALILEPVVVTSDTVIFPYYVNTVTIGIPYQMTLRPTNPVLSSQSSTTRGQQQKLDNVVLSLYQSMGGQFGTDLAHMYDITYGTGTMSQVPSMSTIEISRDLDADWGTESTFYVIQSDPFPFTVRGLVMSLNYNPY